MDKKTSIVKRIKKKNFEMKYRVKRSIKKHNIDPVLASAVVQASIKISNLNNESSSESSSDSDDDENEKEAHDTALYHKLFENTLMVLFNKEDDEKEDNEDIHESIQCIICCNRKRKIMIYPCKHLKYCITCTKKWMFKDQRLKKKATCPVCRVKIDRVERIYL